MPVNTRRSVFWAAAAAVVVGLVYLMATASTGPLDPTEITHPQSHATIVFNAAMIVFREGLEAVLIFAAVTASFRGANASRRRPVVLGALCAFAAAVVTWFVVQAVLDAASPLGPRLEAITGFIAIVVLLLVLNWFVHKVYWSEWIARHHRRRRTLLASAGIGATLGLVALGFTSVYREGFEVVLFLQNLQLQDGTGTVLEGVALGLAATAVVGVAHVLAARQAALPAHADPHRRARRRRARRDDRRNRAELRRPRLAPAPRHALHVPHGSAPGLRSTPSGRPSPPRRSPPCSWSAPTTPPSTSRSSARGGGGRSDRRASRHRGARLGTGRVQVTVILCA